MNKPKQAAVEIRRALFTGKEVEFMYKSIEQSGDETEDDFKSRLMKEAEG